MARIIKFGVMPSQLRKEGILCTNCGCYFIPEQGDYKAYINRSYYCGSVSVKVDQVKVECPNPTCKHNIVINKPFNEIIDG